MAALGCASPLATPVGFVKIGEGDGRKGRNWAPSLFVGIGVRRYCDRFVDSVVGGSWGLFSGESFFDMISCSIPIDVTTG